MSSQASVAPHTNSLTARRLCVEPPCQSSATIPFPERVPLTITLKRFPYALAVALFALTAGARAQSTYIEVAADEARVEFSSRGPLAEMRVEVFARGREDVTRGDTRAQREFHEPEFGRIPALYRHHGLRRKPRRLPCQSVGDPSGDITEGAKFNVLVVN